MFYFCSASFDNIRLWDLEYRIQDTPPTPAMHRKTLSEASVQTPKSHQSYQDEIFPDIKRDSYDMEYFMKQPSTTPSPTSQSKMLDKKAEQNELLEQDLLTPSMPFTIVAGHHGGVISAICN